MKFVVLATLLLGAAAASATPSPPQSCHLQATARPAPGLDSAFNPVPFRFITIVNPPAPCPPARVRLGHYGGGPFSGPETLLRPGQQITYGPVPLYRTAEHVVESGAAYTIPIRPGGAP